MTAEDVPAPFKIRKTGTPDIDLLAQTMQNKNDSYSKDNPFILDIESDAFSPPTPTFFEDANDLNNSLRKIMPRPCRVPKPSPS